MYQELLHKYFTETLTAAEKELLMEELSHNEDLQQDFCELKRTDAFVQFTPHQNDIWVGRDQLNKFNTKQSNKEKQTFNWRSFAGYAAAVSLTFIITYLGSTYFNGELKQTEIAYLEFSTPAGQRAKLTLPDSSSVWLNAKSTLRFPNQFAESSREVHLDGEGYFEIKHNPAKPFIVSTSKAHVKVLGTTFNMFAYSAQPYFSTTLIEGKVNVYLPTTPNEQLTLSPNEIAEIKGGKLVASDADNKNSLLWIDGIYAFENMLFMDIVEKLELYYDIKINVKNQQICTDYFNGKFRQRDGIEGVLNTLIRVKHFTYTKDKEKNEITIY